MKRLYILLLLTLPLTLLSAQNIRFYKYGRVVKSVNMAELDSISTITDYSASKSVRAELNSLQPSESGNQWVATFFVYNATQFDFAFSPIDNVYPDTLEYYTYTELRYGNIANNRLKELGIYEINGINNAGDHSGIQIYMESERNVFVYFRTHYEDVPFYSESYAISTGFLLSDAMKMGNCDKTIEMDGKIVGFSNFHVNQFLLKYANLLGENDPGGYATDLFTSYLQTHSFNQLNIDSSIEYTGGIFYVLGCIPETGAEEYIQSYLQIGNTIIVDSKNREFTQNTAGEVMNLDSVACQTEWNAPWTYYYQVNAKKATDRSEISYNTPLLSPNQKYDIYITMVSESLPTWFQVKCSIMNNNGKFYNNILDNPSPITAESDVPNAEVISSQSGSQRYFVTETNTCERILIQRRVSANVLSPMTFTITATGPSSSKYREVIYTRTLRIAGIEMIPSEE